MESNGLKTLIVGLYPYNGASLDAWHDHGAGMTYTSAKLANCDVSFLDMKTLNNDEELKVALKGYDLVSFGLKSSYYSIGMKVIEYAKAHGSMTLVGGYHATAAPQELLDNKSIDYVFHGESEITFPQFLKNHKEFKREIFGEKPKDLDSLPFIDRSIYRDQLEDCGGWWHGNKFSKMISVMAARGCPYKCGFCQPLENNHFGKALRRRSVDSMIAELEQLKELYNPECVMIHDDTFLLQPAWLEEFIEKYPKIGLPFWAAGRADGICKYPKLVKRLVNIGWSLISVGFESGSQRILDKLSKGTTVEQNIEAAKIIKSCGAKIYANYMIGLPWETREDIQATVKMANIIEAEMPSWAFFTPYPGCELGEECIKDGTSLLDRTTYNRCPSGKKVKGVDYDYVNLVFKHFREPNTFCDIIIPTYENSHFTIACINSIKAYTKEGTYRIIWVDNGSKDTSAVDEVIKNTNHISIKLPTNLGFVGAINEGLKASDAPTICLLNNDTEVSPRWLEKMITILYSDKSIGIVGPLTAPIASPESMQFDSHHNVYYQAMTAKIIFPEYKDIKSFNKELEKDYKGKVGKVDFIAFLCGVMRRSVVDKIGLLDVNYEIGMWDDLDYNMSMFELGYRCVLTLDTCIIHKGRSTFKLISNKESFDVDDLIKRNRNYLDNKWNIKTLDTCIITRAIYDTCSDEPGSGNLSEKRLQVMQRYFINSLRNQTDTKFTLHIIVGEEGNEATDKIKALDYSGLEVNFIYTNPNLSVWRETPYTQRGMETLPGCPEDIIRSLELPKNHIMARMDTDDWVAPGWIAHMKHMAKLMPEENFIINYQVISQAPDGRLYNLFYPHKHSRISPFFAMVQKRNIKVGLYDDKHLDMGKFFDNIYTVPPSYAFMVIHEENRSNRIYEKDTPINGVKDNKKQTIEIPLTKNPSGWKSRIAHTKVH